LQNRHRNAGVKLASVRAFFAVILLTASAAYAQPAESPPQEQTPGVAAFQAGRELLDAGKFEAACVKFTEALQLDPDAPGTLLNLGLCNEMAGRPATALRWYRKVQFRSAEAQMSDVEEAAKQRAVVLAARVPTLRIEASPGVKVTVDGASVSEVERGRVELDPGPHVIQAGDDRRELTVKEGDKQLLTFAAAAQKMFIVVDRGAKQRRTAYYLIGAGGALYLATATLSVIGKSRYDATDHPETYQRWQNIVRFGGSSLFLAGSAAVTGGLYLYFKAPKRERIEQVAPIVSRDQLGVALVGSF